MKIAVISKVLDEVAFYLESAQFDDIIRNSVEKSVFVSVRKIMNSCMVDLDSKTLKLALCCELKLIIITSPQLGEEAKELALELADYLRVE